MARHEIQERIARFPDAARLLRYPSFVGTLTAFFHTFLAFPLLRGLGWQVTCVDDDMFAARALAIAQGKPTLRTMLRSAARRQQVESWLTKLTVAADFELAMGKFPVRLKLAPQPRLPAATSNSGAELEEVKAELALRGVYRYADMLAFARRAMKHAPDLTARLSARFPLVVLDEAQDSSATHLNLVDQVFGAGRSALQRIGDCNQAILHSDEAGDVPWTPATGHIDLGESLRFGAGIADIASKITCRRQQTIEGRSGSQSWPPHVMLVAKDSEPLVGQRFAELVATKLTGSIPPEIWAVGWTHAPSDSENAVRLGTYFTSYEPPQRSTEVGKTVLGTVQAELARRATDECRDLADTVDAYTRQIRSLLIACLPPTEVPSTRRLWRWLDEKCPGAAREGRAVLLDVVRLNGRPSASEWAALARRLRDALQLVLPRAAVLRGVDAQLAYAPAASTAARTANRGRHEAHDIAGRPVHIRIGTISSEKGRTHDATLVVETTSGAVRDVCWALEIVTGKVKHDGLNSKPRVQKAVMNVFVGATRPRYLLCFALRSDDRSEKLRAGLEAQGIIVTEVP